MKKYALLVPCFNARTYIDGFLENVGKLTVAFDEIIFYDDASLDDTAAYLRSKNLKVIQSQENNGPGYARNRLADASSCNYIHFHDIDDEFNPAFLQLVDQIIDNNSFCDVIFGNAEWIDANSRELVIRWQYSNEEILKDTLAYFISHPLGIINTVYKRDIFLKVKGFNENIKCWEDADLHVRLAAVGAEFRFINEILAYSLRHGNGISKDQGWCWKCRLKFLIIYLQSYLQLVDKSIFETEMKKVQNAFIISGLYEELGSILKYQKEYHLNFGTWKVKQLYLFSRIFPNNFIHWFMKKITYEGKIKG